MKKSNCPLTAADKAWVVVLAELLAFECWQIAHGRETLSESVWTWSSKTPLLPFGVGIIFGHLFFQAVKQASGNANTGN